MKTRRQWYGVLVSVVLLSACAAWADRSPAASKTGVDRSLTAHDVAVAKLTSELPMAKVHRLGSRITRVYGQPLSIGTTPARSADQFLAGHVALFGVGPDELKRSGLGGVGVTIQPVMFDRHTGDYKFALVRYTQQKSGLPVFRSDLRLLIRNEANFPLVLAASSLRRLGDFTPDPEIAKRVCNPSQLDTGMDHFSQPETVIWAGVDNMNVTPREAHTFIGKERGPNGHEKWLFVTDAVTGKILYRENMIINTDVVGNVSGMTTEGPKADFCSAEVATPMPWAAVSIQGGNSAYASGNGDYVIPNGGTSSVDVESPMYGRYFVVTDLYGPEDLLIQSEIPPGPADFMHNESNSSECVLAQVNAYVQANLVRDFALTYNPDYPIISTELDFPVNVNSIDAFYGCPGNAWYDYLSINFCVAGDGHPNSAFSVIVHHEYGHHMVQCGGSGQAEYGEGMADSISMLIADDPILAYGWNGDCNVGIRSGDNDLQYPCMGEIHYCGQLLSGCIWDTRNQLAVIYPDTYLDILSNLTVNSILLHTGTIITPQITLDFLVLDDDDDNLGNGTPHWSEICAGFGAHNMDCPPLVPCVVPEDCDDGLFCNGLADCFHGLCVPYDPCDDGVYCSIDTCDEETDTCSHVPDDSRCVIPSLPCLVCYCDVDAPAPSSGCLCYPDPANSYLCDDGQFCNGEEYCTTFTDECVTDGNPCILPEQGCDEVHDVCVFCDYDGVCELGEDCNTCPNDCPSMGCGNSICETADGEDCYSCPEDCNGSFKGSPSKWFCCSSYDYGTFVSCADSRCTDDGNTCTTIPAGNWCCGDLDCEEGEDETNCPIDCVASCVDNSECDDTNECTVDECVDGMCLNTPITPGTPCSGGICCGDQCTVPACFVDGDCDDGEACTTDTCLNGGMCSAYCDNVWAACGIADGCCGPTCTPADDPDCACLPKGASCSSNSECCSNKCRGGSCR